MSQHFTASSKNGQAEMFGFTRIVFGIICLAGADLNAQVSLQCKVDSNVMLIGDQRLLSITISGNTAGYPDSIHFNQWDDKAFTVLNEGTWEGSPSQQIRKEILFTVFDTGYIVLDPLLLTFSSNGYTDSIYSNDLALEVLPVLVDSTGLAPLKDIMREPLRLRDLAVYLGALAILLVGVGYYLWRKRQTNTLENEFIVVRPADEVALANLAALKAEKLWQGGNVKLYQTKLTRIIRTYLEHRFQIRALESTTPDILSEVKAHITEQDLIRDLDQILNIADLIKFAKARPAIDIHSEFMEKAELFVTKTRIQITESPHAELD